MTKPNSHDGGMMSGRTTVKTFSGQFVDFADPQPESIHLLDIATGLANTGRYSGQTKRYYSVAEHTILVRELVKYMGGTKDQQLIALFHDADEAYTGDVTAPLKYQMRQESKAYVSPYDVIAHRVEDAIVQRFQLPSLDDALVKHADMWALYLEAQALTAGGVTEWRYDKALPNGGLLPSTIEWNEFEQRPSGWADDWFGLAYSAIKSSGRS